jgi:hypothetical protein
MLEVITANYVRDGDEWQVSVIGDGKTLTASGGGLIAARDQADQLIEKLVPKRGSRTVVHLLDGDGFEFTLAYLHARLGLSGGPDTGPTPPAPDSGAKDTAAAPDAGKADAVKPGSEKADADQADPAATDANPTGSDTKTVETPKVPAQPNAANAPNGTKPAAKRVNSGATKNS